VNAELAKAYADLRAHETSCLLCKHYAHLCETGCALRRIMTNVQLPKKDSARGTL
jgi:radical SAM protein with 4Fe4S-binding SPASM domain